TNRGCGHAGFVPSRRTAFTTEPPRAGKKRLQGTGDREQRLARCTTLCRSSGAFGHGVKVARLSDLSRFGTQHPGALEARSGSLAALRSRFARRRRRYVDSRCRTPYLRWSLRARLSGVYLAGVALEHGDDARFPPAIAEDAGDKDRRLARRAAGTLRPRTAHRSASH